MKNTLTFLFTLFALMQLKAQEVGIGKESQKEQQYDENHVYSNVDVKAEPKEGLTAFYRNFAKEFQASELYEGLDEVSIRLKFIVEKDGSFSNIQIIDDKERVGEEAVRVLKTMPDWKSAIHKEKSVRSFYTLPIRIVVNNKLSSNNSKKTTNESIQQYLNSLKFDKIENEYFEFQCNCTFVKSTKHENKMDEFSYQSPDSSTYYSIGLRVVEPNQIENYLNEVKKSAEIQKGDYKDIIYNNKKAVENSFMISQSNHEYYYQTIFFIEDNYLIGLNVVSSNKQVSDFIFTKLKESFKLKNKVFY